MSILLPSRRFLLRRRPRWTPANIQTALWLDAADAATITLNGSTVSQWNDKSGNGRNVVQATASAQPTYTASGLNGGPALTFNSANLQTLSNTFNLNNTGFLIVYVGSSGMRSGQTSTIPRFYFESSSISYNAFSIAAWSASAANKIVAWRFDGINAHSIFENGTNVASGTQSLVTTGFAATYFIGRAATSYSDGFYGEYIVVASDISVFNLQRIEGYLAHKWRLTANLPADHPFRNVAP